MLRHVDSVVDNLARAGAALVKQTRNGLFGGGTANCFADKRGDFQNPDITRGKNFLRRLNRVGNDELLQARSRDAFDGAARKHAVTDVGIYRLGLALE